MGKLYLPPEVLTYSTETSKNTKCSDRSNDTKYTTRYRPTTLLNVDYRSVPNISEIGFSKIEKSSENKRFDPIFWSKSWIKCSDWHENVAKIALIPVVVVPFLTDSWWWGKVNNECQRLEGGGSDVSAIYLRLSDVLNLLLFEISIIIHL